MQRAVITGFGIVSCIGNDRQTVLDALKQGKSGIHFNQLYADMGLKCHISGRPNFDINVIDRKLRRFMGEGAAYSYYAALQAIADAGLSLELIAHNPRYGIVAGSGGASSSTVEAADILRTEGIRRVLPTMVPRSMTNSIAANIATGLKLRGINYAISSACATSSHCIGHAAELIAYGRQDIVLAGGGDDEHWSQAVQFDAMGAINSDFNDRPEAASRPYDAARCGFSIAGGGGIVIVESLDHALARGANILAEVIGFGATSDGDDMVAPSGEGAIRCIQMALAGAACHGVTKIDYINTHGTSTPVGDIPELNAIAQAFAGKPIPPISSTKSITGHSLGASGVHEVIYCLLMMQHGFIAPSINIDSLDEGTTGFDIVQQTRYVPINNVMSNSFGFGGTNGTLILKRWAE